MPATGDFATYSRPGRHKAAAPSAPHVHSMRDLGCRLYQPTCDAPRSATVQLRTYARGQCSPMRQASELPYPWLWGKSQLPSPDTSPTNDQYRRERIITKLSLQPNFLSRRQHLLRLPVAAAHHDSASRPRRLLSPSAATGGDVVYTSAWCLESGP